MKQYGSYLTLTDSKYETIIDALGALKESARHTLKTLNAEGKFIDCHVVFTLEEQEKPIYHMWWRTVDKNTLETMIWRTPDQNTSSVNNVKLLQYYTPAELED